MNLQESIKKILREETERKTHQTNADAIQQLVDMEMEQIKEDCYNQDSETYYGKLISFSTCEFITFDPEVRVTEFLKNYPDRTRSRVLIQIKVKNNTITEWSFIIELQRRLKKWIGPNMIEVEDIIYV